MTERNTKVLTDYIDALTEREAALTALSFLPVDKHVECEARIAKLDRIIDDAEAVFDNDQLSNFEAALEARRHRVEDLILHLERMGARPMSGNTLDDLLLRLQAVEKRPDRN